MAKRKGTSHRKGGALRRSRRSNATGRKRTVKRQPQKRRSQKSKAGRRRRSQPSVHQRFMGYAGEASFFLFSFAFAAAALVIYITRDLPSTDGLWRNDQSIAITLVARDGSPIRVHGQSQGAPIRLADLPSHVPQSILAIEDRNFYHHIGVNPFAVMRALLVNAREGEVRQGGSTITQQLAKNLFLSAEKTYKRKFQELFLALWLEQRFTKDELLTLYLNRVYFGAGAWGIDGASFRYFGKPAHSLTLPEAAILAGLLKAPSQYAPNRNPDDAGERGRLVIEAMMDTGYISYEEAQHAIASPVYLSAPRFSGAPYFVDYVLGELKTVKQNANADIVVRTTLDPDIQDAVENAIEASAAEAGLPVEAQIAIVVLSDDGAVRAMVGGRDYQQSQFNRVTQARRQPGSAFKPFVFLAALEQGADRWETLLDEPLTIGNWSPNNYGGDFYGEVSMAEALARSLNAATIRLQEETGRGAVRLAARRAGIEAPLSKGASLALGVDVVTPLELASAYAPFANGGYRVRLRGFEKVDTVEGAPVSKSRHGLEELVASRGSIDAIDEMLRSVTKWGTGRKAAVHGYEVAGKTGTTQSSRDAWFVGYAGGYVTVVWVGRDDNAPLATIDGEPVTGGGAPAIIWRNVMGEVLDERPLSLSPATVNPEKSASTAG